ncbi:hypothetical protein [Nocardia bhagyanarayanae]|uniref:Arsenate reductase n=1 Tax=Nocardia bhagyanarayanae TaxID=1215925 RepID=A0A543FGP1_9NOCA|nr:hypothetical protein [Nocardia bhagyanarayanae]TQM32926.1 hypothetical protein FB390_4629 [Nocardia bhagyanarayanae]
MTISSEDEGGVPDACTLPTAEQPMRIAEFDRFFAEFAHTARRTGPARLELLLDPAAEPTARDLAARESSCCSFLTFDFDTTEAGLVMGIGVPGTYVDVLDAFAARADSAIGGAR